MSRPHHGFHPPVPPLQGFPILYQSGPPTKRKQVQNRIYKRRSFYQSALLHIFWENVNTRKLQQTDQVLNLDNCKIIARSWEGDMWTGGNIHISSLKLLAEQSAPSLHHQKTTLMHSQQNWLKKGIHILLYYVYIIYQITRSR